MRKRSLFYAVSAASLLLAQGSPPAAAQVIGRVRMIGSGMIAPAIRPAAISTLPLLAAPLMMPQALPAPVSPALLQGSIQPHPQKTFRQTSAALGKSLVSDQSSLGSRTALDAFFSGSKNRKNAAGEYLDSVIRRNTYRSSNDGAITRGIQKYAHLLGRRFTGRLLRIDGRDHVMDLGAGEAVFAAELAGERSIVGHKMDRKLRTLKRRASKTLPKVTAVTYKLKNRDVVESENFRPLKGRYFENIPDDELLGDFGKVTLATDMMGVLAYTASPSVVLRKLHTILADKGELYLRVGPPDFQAIRSVMSGLVQSPRSSLYTSTVRTSSGRTLTFPDWLSKIPGFTVEKLEKGTVLRIRKDPKRRLRIPHLRLKKIARFYMPPGRTFIED